MKTLDYRYEPENRRAASYMAGELIGQATYTVEGQVWTLDHTFVDEKARGRGVAAELIALLAAAAREAQVKVVPQCSYAKAVFERTPAYQDLLAQR